MAKPTKDEIIDLIEKYGKASAGVGYETRARDNERLMEQNGKMIAAMCKLVHAIEKVAGWE